MVLSEMDEVAELVAHAAHGTVEVLAWYGPVVVGQLAEPLDVIVEDQLRIGLGRR